MGTHSVVCWQTLLELKQIILFVFEKGHATATAAVKAAANVNSLPAFNIVKVTNDSHQQLIECV